MSTASKSKRRATIFGWCLLVFSLLAGIINVTLYLMGIITEAHLILVTLALSWFAITLTAWDIIKTSKVNEEQDDE